MAPNLRTNMAASPQMNSKARPAQSSAHNRPARWVGAIDRFSVTLARRFLSRPLLGSREASARHGEETAHECRQARHPGFSSRTGRVARCRRLGALPTVWHDDGGMMATWFQGPARRIHPREPGGLGQGRQHSAFPRRDVDRSRRRPRDRADQDDDLAARRRRTACCATSSAPAASTTSSKNATGAGASCCASRSTRRTASIPSTLPRRLRSTSSCWPLPRGLSPPRLYPARHRLQSETRHACTDRQGGRGALRTRRQLARRPAAVRGYALAATPSWPKASSTRLMWWNIAACAAAASQAMIAATTTACSACERADGLQRGTGRADRGPAGGAGCA